MGLRSLFMRHRAAAGTTAPTAVVGSEQEHQEPLTPEQLAELQEAWVELTNAAEGSDATGLLVCSRNGKPWQEDPAAVRGVAATLRAHFVGQG